MNAPRILKKLGRWLLVCAAFALALFTLAGRWRDPWLWAYMAVLSSVGLYVVLFLDDDLTRERLRPPVPGADRLSLKVIRLFTFAHVVVGALDVGRWHISRVPEAVRLVSLAGMALAAALVFRAMTVNRFFSAVVRIQSDRGHRVVDRGPYARVRHPGYAGMILTIPFSALVLGSWLALAIALLYSLMMLRRVLFEDAYLRTHLEGYVVYASRVRYRLVPGVW